MSQEFNKNKRNDFVFDGVDSKTTISPKKNIDDALKKALRENIAKRKNKIKGDLCPLDCHVVYFIVY